MKTISRIDFINKVLETKPIITKQTRSKTQRGKEEFRFVIIFPLSWSVKRRNKFSWDIISHLRTQGYYTDSRIGRGFSESRFDDNTFYHIHQLWK